MKILKYAIIATFTLALVSGCGGKSSTTPPTTVDPVQSGSGQITERTLDGGAAEQGATAPKGAQPVSPAQIQQRPQQPAMTAQAKPLTLGFINGRIIEYEQRLDQWKQLDEQSMVTDIDQQQTELMLNCYRSLQKLLEGYRGLQQEKLQSTMNQVASPDAPELLRADVDFLEGNCNTLLSGGSVADSAGQPFAGTSDAGQQIAQQYADGAYQEVIASWDQLPAYQAAQLDPKIRAMYGNALMHEGLVERAAEVYQKLVDEIAFATEQPMDLISMRKRLADLYTAAGKYLAAEGQYDKISSDYLELGKLEEWSRQQVLLLERNYIDDPELDDYARLLRSYLAFIVERDGFKTVLEAESFLQKYPYSPVNDNVDLIKEDVQKQAQTWFDGLLAQIDQAIEANDFDTALEMIQAVPADILGGDNYTLLSQREDSITVAQEVERLAVERERLEDLQNRWDQGEALSERGDLDGAIAAFTELLETEEYGAKAEQQIRDLSLTAAKAERRKAADYFVRFSKATDVETKKEMLIESRRILKSILKKYPEVEIASKVSGNIRRVEKEMNVIDPLLLPAIEREEWEQAMQEKQQQETMVEEEVDVFDMPLSPPPEPEPAKSLQPLPVVVPQPLQ